MAVLVAQYFLFLEPYQDYPHLVQIIWSLFLLDFLKCRGQILSADQYPNLARVIGVGARCIYKKEGTQLLEPNPDGTGGTLQLPDLGSKYIAGASNPGVYSNDTTFNPRTNTTVDRAGIEVEISSQGQSVEFFYDGILEFLVDPLL
jgi:hypothetical protein